MRRQRGVAFILVLWLLALLTILLGSFALIARTESLQARHLFDTFEGGRQRGETSSGKGGQAAQRHCRNCRRRRHSCGGGRR